MKKRNEKTSKRIAAIAGRFLRAEYVGCVLKTGWKYKVISSDDAKALAASALTQTAPKPKKNGRVSIGKYRYRRRSVVKNPRKPGGK